MEDLKDDHEQQLQNSDRAEDRIQLHPGRPMDLKMDTQKRTRIQKSREYSRKYRVKQLQHTMALEGKVKQLQVEVAVAYPQIHYFGHQRKMMKMQNSLMKEKISTLTDELLLKEAQTQELKTQIDILKKKYHTESQLQQQQLIERKEAWPTGMETGARVEDIIVNSSSCQTGSSQFLDNMTSHPILQDSFNYFELLL